MQGSRTDLMGLPLDPVTAKEALAGVDDAVRGGKPLSINFLNAAKYLAADRDAALKESLQESDLMLPDGMPVVWAGRRLGLPVPERVAGIDLMERILKQGRAKGYRFFFLGARQDVLETFVQKARERYPAIEVAGMRNGYFTEDEEEEVVREIASSNADVLFVAMGSPAKERFIRRHRTALNVKVAMGVGGSFDVLAGLVPRAPLWMQNAGLEWAYRLMREPGRMWKRYLTGNSWFVMKFLAHFFMGGRNGPDALGRDGKAVLALAFLFLFLKSLAFALLLPPWMGNDEPNHYDYVLVKAGRGAGDSNQREIIDSLNRTRFWDKAEMPPAKFSPKNFRQTALWQHSENISGSRPPLYYYLAGLPYRLLGVQDMETGLLLARMVSVVISMGTLFVIFLCGMEFFSGDRRGWYALFAALFAGLHPQFSYLSVTVNADVLGFFFFSLAFYLVLRAVNVGRVGTFGMVSLLLVFCLALLTKKHALLLLPVIMLLPLLTGGGLRTVGKEWGLFAGLLVVALLALELMFPGVVYKLADRLAIAFSEFFATPEDMGALTLAQWVRGMGIIFVTFWFTYGQMVHKLSFGLYAVYLLFTLGILAGIGRGLMRPVGAEVRKTAAGLLFIGVILAAIVLTFFEPRWVDRVSARYLFYAIAPISVLAVYGIQRLAEVKRPALVEEGSVAFMLVMNLAAVFLYLLPLYYCGGCD